MNPQTEQFLEDREFNALLDELRKHHRPIKAEIASERLEGIGLIVVKFQRLEMTLQQSIVTFAGLAGRHPVGGAMTVSMSFGRLLDTLAAVSEAVAFPRKDELRFLIKKAGQAERVRNQVVHSVWTREHRLKKRAVRTKGVIFSSESYDPGDLRRIADQIDGVDTAIEALMFAWMESATARGEKIPGVRLIKPPDA